MLQNTIKIIISSLAIIAGFGVVIHDTQLDKATIAAFALPITVVGYAAADAAIKSGDAHIHVERTSLARVNGLRTTLPCLNPRDDGRHTDKQRKVAFHGADAAESLWPSI